MIAQENVMLKIEIPVNVFNLGHTVTV